MHAQTRSIVAVGVALAAMAGFPLAQGRPTAAQVPQGAAQQAPAPAPAGQGVAPAGQGGAPTGARQTGPGQGGPAPAAPGQGAQPGAGGGRRGGFAQFTRELAPQDVLVRGKSLYEANCASCHAPDLRGGDRGSNLLRSGTALADRKGELVGAAIAAHTPTITLTPADAVAIAEYIHGVHATMSGQGSPPGRNPTDIELNILVGDPKSGEAVFRAACTGCHSLSGDLKGIGSKYPDPRTLQNAWVAGTSARFGGGRGRGGAGAGNPAVVTLADGSKLEGTLVRQDDWLVILTLPDGTRRSMARTNGIPKVDVKDPAAAHKQMVLELDDPGNKKMHDVTAYLWSVK